MKKALGACAVMLLTALSACGGGGGGSASTGQVVINTDANGVLQSYSVNCTVGAKQYIGTVDLAGKSIDFSAAGACSSVNGSGDDLANCTGSISLNCNNVDSQCKQSTGATGTCVCDKTGLTQQQAAAVDTFAQEEQVVIGLQNAAATAVANGQCTKDGTTYTCKC